MSAVLQVPFVAGMFSLLLAGVSVVRRQPTPATWCFSAGMIALGVDSLLTGLVLRAGSAAQVFRWLLASAVVKCFIPVIWLAFSLTYSRTDYREVLHRWRAALAVVGVVPIALLVASRERLVQLVPAEGGSVVRLEYGPMAGVLNATLLLACVFILMNLEQTFRAAVGTMRWRIKYVVLALVVIFGARLYVRGQVILFSAPDISLWPIEAAALLIGCLLLTVAYTRTGWREIDVHPSSAVVRSSLTVIIVGGYLVVVGALAVVVRRFGGAEFFQLQALVVLAGMAGLAILLVSDRARQRVQVFVARHFSKAQHDSVRVWALFSQRLASVTDEAGLCAVAAKLVSETFNVLSVTLWLRNEETGRFVLGNSTGSAASQRSVDTLSPAIAAGLQQLASPFDLEAVDEEWAEELRRHNPASFPHGGNRLCISLLSGSQNLGVLVLADRINAATYTAEELELLKCIGDQITSVLLNLRLGGELARAREFEAFRTLSAFFVHDLKNAAASLNLMLKNLPVHFDDPAFRQDALRGIGNTAQRIDDMITRLSAVRQHVDTVRADTDLSQVVDITLAGLDLQGVELVRHLGTVPPIRADGDQVRSVITNMVLNARDATNGHGRIEVRTEHRGNRVVLSVIDNGCGMSPAFVKDSLFRPFQSTKKKGLGIGLFQSRAIILAHGGGVHVESEVGKGTRFHASFPVSGAP